MERFDEEAKPSHLAGYGDDPLAMAMAQSGIETGDQWSFLDLRSDHGGGDQYDPETSPDQYDPETSSDQFGQLACLQTSDEERSVEERLHGRMEEEEGEDEEELEDVDRDLDGLLSAYYYTVDTGEDPDPDPDPDSPDTDANEYTDLTPASVLPRLVASLGWTDADRRPPYTFEELAALAICSSPDRRLTARLAAQFVRQVYPFYRQHEQRLQTCLEQALFASPFFRRLSGGGPLSRPWTVTVEGERRLADGVRRRLGAEEFWRPAKPAWQEDHNYAAESPSSAAAGAGRRRVKLATKT
ncbi:forkhead box protein E1-like [Amphibalanus amphitrite]|uniref:forkhead box protein E1-like n=1 Tax=Amphibalanus amphitrite TaxID=1232801 RepID=UPI001C91CA25|nr:forkhead box protein E1-like [Amphibalanus amphitrite]XP_043205544.1 forkhead box protein E1-like [Amphibalanus amphitrite]